MGKKQWKTHHSEVVHDNPWYQIIRNDVTCPSGSDGVFYQMRYKPLANYCGVLVVPVGSDGKILLVRTNRYTTKQLYWEVPGGGNEPGESIAAAAKRELAEETGYTAENVVPLYKHFFQFAGCSDVSGQVFAASGLKVVKSHKMSEENIDKVAFFSLDEIDNMIIEGHISDAHTIAALYYYKLHLADRQFQQILPSS